MKFNSMKWKAERYMIVIKEIPICLGEKNCFKLNGGIEVKRHNPQNLSDALELFSTWWL